MGMGAKQREHITQKGWFAMGKNLLDGLEVCGKGAPVKEAAAVAAPAGVPERDGAGVWELPIRVAGIEVEAAVHGCLMKIRLEGNVCPSDVLPWLKSLDPGVKVRDDFPKGKFGGGFGSKDTKLARLMMVTARITDTGKFVELACQNGDDVMVKVSKKASETFLADLRALGVVSEKSMAKLEKAFDDKGNAMVILTKAEPLGVRYWTTEDGNAHFLDSFTTELPAAPAGDGDAHE